MGDNTKSGRIKGLITKFYKEIDAADKMSDSELLVSKVTFDIGKWGNIGKTEDFIGRTDEMNIIRTAIFSEKRIVHLIGVDGVGKSEICRQMYSEFVDIRRDEEKKNMHNKKLWFPIYMHYSYNMDDTLLNTFCFAEDIKHTECVELAWRYLEMLTEKYKVLLFIDGINNSLVQDERLSRLLNLNCTSVITSNDNIYHNSPELIKLRISSLTDEETITLFKTNYQLEMCEADLDDVKYIVKELADNHTLTIKLLASLARSRDWDISYLVGQLERCNFKMSAIFFYSDELDILVNEYKKILKLLKPDYAEKSIMEGFAVLPYDDYSLKFCLEWFGDDCESKDFAYTIEALRNKGWLEYDEELQYSMNPVLAMVIIRSYNPNVSEHINMVKTCDRYLQLFALRISDDVYPYWRFAEIIVSELYDEKVYSLGQLATRAGDIFLARLEYERARSLYRRAVVIFEHIFGRCHLETASAYFNLAGTYEKCGDLNNSLSHYHVALEIQESTFMGKEQEYTGVTYSCIASIYAKKGKYENAIQCYTRSLEIKEKTIGFDNLATATIYNNLANVYMEMNKFEKALSYYCIANDLREKLVGKQNSVTIQSYINIAGAYRKLMDYSDSIKYYKKSIELTDKEYKSPHIMKSKAYNGMAAAYAKQGKYDKAKQCCSKSIEICEKIYGIKSTFVATAYNTLALVYLEEKDYINAEKYLALSLSIVEKVSGKNNILTTHIYKELAGIYRNQKKYIEAYSYYEKAAKIRDKYLGPSHPETVWLLEKMDEVKKLVDSDKVIKIRNKSN